MFVHISPDIDAIGETISTLKFAERVSSVELGAAQLNKESGEVKELREQVFLILICHCKLIYNTHPSISHFFSISRFFFFSISGSLP